MEMQYDPDLTLMHQAANAWALAFYEEHEDVAEIFGAKVSVVQRIVQLAKMNAPRTDRMEILSCAGNFKQPGMPCRSSND
jgi:hypothetical protein